MTDMSVPVKRARTEESSHLTQPSWDRQMYSMIIGELGRVERELIVARHRRTETNERIKMLFLKQRELIEQLFRIQGDHEAYVPTSPKYNPDDD